MKSDLNWECLIDLINIYYCTNVLCWLLSSKWKNSSSNPPQYAEGTVGTGVNIPRRQRRSRFRYNDNPHWFVALKFSVWCNPSSFSMIDLLKQECLLNRNQSIAAFSKRLLQDSSKFCSDWMSSCNYPSQLPEKERDEKVCGWSKVLLEDHWRVNHETRGMGWADVGLLEWLQGRDAVSCRLH